VIVGVQAIPACFDVEHHRFTSPAESFDVHLQSYDTLLGHPIHTDRGGRRAEDPGALSAGLAESWDTSHDGRVVTLRLRRGVASADGHELTAHDVKWSWERAFALKSWSARIARQCGACTPDALHVMQPYMLRFQLDEPNPRFPAVLAAPFPPIYDLEAVRQHCPVGDPWGDLWLRTHTAGFGPYALDEVVPQDEATLRANMGYWRGAPRERTVVLRTIAPAAERVRALTHGSIDIASDLPSHKASALASDPNLRVIQMPSTRQVVLRIDPAFAPLSQAGVRTALALAMPYEAIRQELGSLDSGQPAIGQQDHRAARRLLKDAGYGSGFRVSLAFPAGNSDLQKAAEAIQVDLIRLNLKVVLEATEPGLFAREKEGRHLPVYLDERRLLTSLLTYEQHEPLPEVQTIVLAEPPALFVARSNVAGLVLRADGRPRYADLRKQA
jgi:peptide/nickel transport system substrate-binding protein